MNTSTLSPAGSPGSAVGPSPTMPETIPTNPSTISQSTSINTLSQVLTENWIYDNTFSWQTSAAPGTILYYKKIHPRGWNWANTYVSQMFNTYTGAGAIRFRPMGTAWYGGDICVGFLPPTLTESEVTKVPLDILTTYPTLNTDPKNTDWIEFNAVDQRNVAYHYLNDTDPRSFGGWVVWYVQARLVPQSAEFTAIQMLVQTRGGFVYDQVNPFVTREVDTQDHPLKISSQISLGLQPMSMWDLQPFFNIQIEAATTTVLNWPSLNHAGFGTPNITLGNAQTLSLIHI